MGVILSVAALTSDSIKKSLHKRKARKAAKRSSTSTPATAATSQKDQPSFFGSRKTEAEHEEAIRIAQLGLQGEHLAATSPPVPTGGTALRGTAQQVDRKVGVQAPVPLATTGQSSTLPIPAGKLKSSETKTTTRKENMASDEDYASFLEKANEDPGAGSVKNQSAGKQQLKALDKGEKVPTVLQKATKDAFYVSDADEQFEPVVLKMSGKRLPDEGTFAKLVNHPNPNAADVSILDIGEWDPQGQYQELVDAVREATKGSDVRVYRISKDGARVEYWVVGIMDGKMVGAKALAIES